MTTWQPNPRHPHATPPDSIPADETPLEAIDRACTALENLHGLTTIAGSRARDHTSDIRAAAKELADAADRLTRHLEDAQTMIDEAT